jgi:hypothetical protein
MFQPNGDFIRTYGDSFAVVSSCNNVEKKTGKCFHSSSRPGMYNKLTSKTTVLFGGTLGLPGAEVRPFGNASCS